MPIGTDRPTRTRTSAPSTMAASRTRRAVTSTPAGACLAAGCAPPMQLTLRPDRSGNVTARMIAAALAAAVLYGAGAAVEQRQEAAAPVSSAGRPRLLFGLARQPLVSAGDRRADRRVRGARGGAAVRTAGDRADAGVRGAHRRGGHRGHLAGPPAGPGLPGCGADSGRSRRGVPGTDLAGSRSRGRPAGLRRSGGPGRRRDRAGALAAAVAGLRAAGRRRAVLLAVAAGLADSCPAVVTMAFSRVASRGLAALAASWTLYALAASGGGNVLLTRTAYQAGP